MSNSVIKQRIKELIAIIYNEYSCTGGELHIVLDDYNVENHHIEWCLKNSIPTIENQKEKEIYAECANLLLKISYSKRINTIKGK